MGSKLFDQKSFRRIILKTQNIFGPKIQPFWDPKDFQPLTINLAWPTIFLDPIIFCTPKFSPELFWTSIFLHNFFDKNLFGPKSIWSQFCQKRILGSTNSDLTFFYPKYFWTQHSFGHIFGTQNFLAPKISLAQNCLIKRVLDA